MQRSAPTFIGRGWRRAVQAGALAALPMFAATVMAAATPPGNDVLLTTGLQLGDVAADATGRFVVVSAESSPAPAISARQYSARGAPIGLRFPVDYLPSTAVDSPALGRNNAGTFVVAWRRTGPAPDRKLSISARVFNANGTPKTGEIEVAELTPTSPGYPSVALDFSGTFAISWNAFRYKNSGSRSLLTQSQVMVQNFDADGFKVGAERLVASEYVGTAGNAGLHSQVFKEITGAFLVAWNATSAVDKAIRFRRYDPTGTPASAAKTLSGSGPVAGLARASDGSFVAAFERNGPDRLPDIYARVYSTTGAAANAAFRVNSYTVGRQTAPRVAISAFGGFIVTWQSEGQTDGTPPSQHGRSDIFAQRYDSDATPTGVEFRANRGIVFDNSGPRVLIDGEGNATVLYTAFNTGPGQPQVYAHYFLAP